MLVDAKQAGGAGPGIARSARAEGASEAVTAEQLWVKYAVRLTSIVVRYLRADYWHMPQVGPFMLEEACPWSIEAPLISRSAGETVHSVALLPCLFMGPCC